MRTYDKVLNGYTFKFRLTIGKQRELREKYGEETFQTVLAAPNDLGRMSDLLSAAADWPGNNNPTTDGDTIYDLLVDSGVCGMAGILDVATHIAVVSGILDEKARDSVNEYTRREWDRIIADFSGEPADPTSAPELKTPEPVTQEATAP